MSGTPRARLTVRDGEGAEGLVATFAGELDVAGVEDVAAPLDDLLARPFQPLVLDLADLSFLDSSGVAVLIRLANHFESVRLRSPAPPIRRVIEVLGLSDRLGLDRD